MIERQRRRFKQASTIAGVFLLIILFPIYPASGDYLYSKTGGVLHEAIDRSTILGQGEDFSLDLTTDSGFIDINVTVEEDRDWSDRTDIVTYTVQRADTIGGLARDFDLQMSTIRWNNAIS